MARDGGSSAHSGRPYVSLRGRNAFTRVYRSKRRHRRGSVVVISSRGDPGLPQVGFVAGRRIGNAVERNRVKRRLREAVAGVALEDGTAYLVVAHRGVGDAEFTELVDWLEAAVAPARRESERER